MPEDSSDSMLKPDFGKFFIVKVEEMISLMKLPVPPSRATGHSIIHLTNGDATMTIGSKDYTIYKDEILVVQAGQVFSFKSHDINKGYLINFHNDFLIGKFCNNELIKEFEFLNIWGNSVVKFEAEISEFVLQLFKRLYYEYSKNGLRNLDIIHPYLMTILAEIKNVYKPPFESNNISALEITKKFQELLFDNFKTKQLVTDYADMLHISPNHLNKCVKKITSKSPTKWIDEVIILEAKVLLYQTGVSISDIASELGFFEQSYFSRLFKKYEGITPLEFRKRIEKY